MVVVQVWRRAASARWGLRPVGILRSTFPLPHRHQLLFDLAPKQTSSALLYAIYRNEGTHGTVRSCSVLAPRLSSLCLSVLCVRPNYACVDAAVDIPQHIAHTLVRCEYWKLL